jgi:sortase (surface protein transpeptidase)
VRKIGLALAGLLLLTGCGTSQVMPAAEAPPVNGAPVAEQVAEPVSVTIPALDVTDEVVPVGLCEVKAPPRCESGTGEMELPDVSETGWYRYAPKPGEVGRSVFASHVDWEGTPGAFKHLPQVKVGDRITTLDADGVQVEFVVYDTHQVKKAKYRAVTVPLLFGPSQGRELALVTCSGTVVGGNYTDNTIVRARAA